MKTIPLARHPLAPFPLTAAVAVAMALFGSSVAAQAQVAQQPPDTPAPAPDEATLPRVTVTGSAQRETATSPVPGYAARRSATATKTDTPLNEVPQAITVISAEQIRDQGSPNLQEVLRYAPGVRHELYGVDNRHDWFSLRGSSESSMLLDGLRLPMSGWWGVVRNEPHAFERVEVLRGPASVIAGQNGPGGVVNLVSKRPQPEALREVELQLGNHDHKQLAADFAGPLTEDGRLQYRVVALGKRSGTQVEHAVDERDYFAPSVAWEITPETRLDVFAEYQKDHSGNVNAFLGERGTLLPAPNGPISPSLFIGEPDWDRYGGERVRLGYRLEHTLTADWTLRHQLRHDRVEGGMRSMYAAWWEGVDGFVDANGDPDANGTYMRRYWYGTNTDARITNAELLLQGHVDWGRTRHTLLLGVDGIRSRDAQESWDDTYATPLDVYTPVYGSFDDPMRTLAPQNREVVRMNNWGVLLQDQVKIDERFVVVAGLRWDEARTRTDRWREGAPRPGDLAKAGALSKNLGAVFLADGGWSPYLGYSESFQPLGGTDAAGQLFKPQRGKQLEAGVKWAPPASRLNGAAAVFQIKEKNRLVDDPDNVGKSIQAGEVSIKGVELELAANLPAWDLTAAYTHLDAKERGSSMQFAGIPQDQASVWAVHKLSAWGLGGWRVGLGVRHVGRSSDGDDTWVPAVTLYDALVGYENGPWRGALNVGNLTDETYLATCLARGDCWFGAQRRVVLSVAYRW
jgi:iron complex outermembrane receptor protein